MTKYSISVLMSVYNKDEPEFLKIALQSLCNQTEKALEVIIIFDGFLDKEFYNIVSDFENELNIITVQNSENMGLAKSLNKGLQYVNGEVIARMDADDISTNDRFEKQIIMFQDHEVDVVGGYVQEFNSIIENNNTIRKVPTNTDDIVKFSKYRSPVNHPTAMIRTEILRNVGGYPERFNKLEDYALWVSILNEGYSIRNIPEVLVYMRISDATFKRRGGFKQAKAFFSLRNGMLNTGYINKFEWIIGNVISIPVSLMPSILRGSIYKFLRK